MLCLQTQIALHSIVIRGIVWPSSFVELSSIILLSIHLAAGIVSNYIQRSASPGDSIPLHFPLID